MKHIYKPLLLFLILLFAGFNLQQDTYKYNVTNGKYHYNSCRWARECTKNCISLTLKEIRERGGIPCKVCKPPK